MRPIRTHMERRLFKRLWEEVDFDDHPLSGGHDPEPEGELSVLYGKNGIRLEDSRLSIIIGEGDDADSIHRWTSISTKRNQGPSRLGVHRWSMSPDCLDSELREWVIQKIGYPPGGPKCMFPKKTPLTGYEILRKHPSRCLTTCINTQARPKQDA